MIIVEETWQVRIPLCRSSAADFFDVACGNGATPHIDVVPLGANAVGVRVKLTKIRCS